MTTVKHVQTFPEDFIPLMRHKKTRIQAKSRVKAKSHLKVTSSSILSDRERTLRLVDTEKRQGIDITSIYRYNDYL